MSIDAAYRAAWEHRKATGDSSLDVLAREIALIDLEAAWHDDEEDSSDEALELVTVLLTETWSRGDKPKNIGFEFTLADLFPWRRSRRRRLHREAHEAVARALGDRDQEG